MLLDRFVFTLYASDYSNGKWTTRRGNLPVNIPASATFQSNFVHLTGEALFVALSTDPSDMKSVTYVIHLRVLSDPKALGLVMTEQPISRNSRGLAISDLGVGLRRGGYEPTLGKIPICQWNVLIGVWTKDGPCQIWLNGVAGHTRTCAKTDFTGPNLVIGGYDSSRHDKNPRSIDISQVIVYSKALAEDDIQKIQRIPSGKGPFI